MFQHFSSRRASELHQCCPGGESSEPIKGYQRNVSRGLIWSLRSLWYKSNADQWHLSPDFQGQWPSYLPPKEQFSKELRYLDIFDSDFPRNSATRSFALFSLVWPYHILSRCSRLGGVSKANNKPRDQTAQPGHNSAPDNFKAPQGSTSDCKSLHMPSPTFTYVLHVARFHLLMLKLRSTWLQMI